MKGGTYRCNTRRMDRLRRRIRDIRVCRPNWQVCSSGGSVLPSIEGKFVQALSDNYVSAIVLFVGGFVATVDTAVEVFGKIA